MLHSEKQYLQFHCGPFALLLPISNMAKILDFDSALCSPSGDSLAHHGKTTTWNDTALPYLDFRLTLQLAHEKLLPPLSALVLRDNATFQPIAIIAVDDVVGFVEPQAHEWHQTSGINKDIDIFFDRLYAKDQHDCLMMCLKDPLQWLPDTIKTANQFSTNDSGAPLHAH